MNVHNVKNELEKASRFIPELRERLDEAYKLDHGKKSRIKLLWREFQDRYKEVSQTPEFRKLQ